jgi:uncharacterized protein
MLMRFAGYAAVFDRVDQGGDVVRRGAFGRLPRDVPLLWEHRPGAAIGRVELLEEDRRGLRVIGRLEDKRAARLLEAGRVTGLSFGYRVVSSRSFDTRLRQPRIRSGALLRMSGEGAAKRELTGLELVEVSLVAFPMQPAARVHAITSFETGLRLCSAPPQDERV